MVNRGDAHAEGRDWLGTKSMPPIQSVTQRQVSDLRMRKIPPRGTCTHVGRLFNS
jgi:hypothetical protein